MPTYESNRAMSFHYMCVTACHSQHSITIMCLYRKQIYTE